MSMSNVGSRPIYESGDQKNFPRSVLEQEKKENRFHEGTQNSHKALDSKDERSIANKLAREEKRSKEDEPISKEELWSKTDPTLPAKMHGNKPSRGAEIDAELRREDEEYLKKKGKA